MTLKGKLFIWLLIIITTSTALSAIIYYNSMNSLYNKQIQNDHKHDTSIVLNHFNGIKNNIKFLNDDITKNNEFIASLNLIVNYQDENNYDKEVFDNEKYSIIKKTTKWLSTSNNTSIAIYDMNKDLLMSSTRSTNQTSVQIQSYDQSNNKIFLDDNKQLIPKKDLKILKLNSPLNTFATHKEDNQFHLCYTTMLYSLDKPLGYLHVCYILDEANVKEIRKNTVHDLVFEIHNQQILSSIKIIPLLWNKIKNNQYYIVSKSAITENKNDLNFYIITNKKTMQEQLKDTILLTILISFSVFIATFFVSLIIIKKYVLDPISYLRDALNTIYPGLKNKEFKPQNTDELQQMRHEINHIGTNLKKNLAFLKSYQELMDEGSMTSKSDLEGQITYANDRFLKATGYTLEEVLYKPHNILRDPNTPKSTYEKMWRDIKEKKTWRGILKNRCKDGSSIWTKTVIRPILDEKNEIVEYIAMRNDITELIDQRKELERVATTDVLTGFKNRYKLLQTLKSDRYCMLAIINIDNFRQINDFYGHEFGDKVIIALGQTIKNYLDKTPHWDIFHLRADEFVMLCTHCDDQEKATNTISQLQSHIRSQSFLLDKQLLSLRTSIGISYEKQDSLLMTADIALKYAKKESKDVVIYTDDNPLQKEYENNIKWTFIIETAIKNDKIVPYFQPIYNNHTNKIEKYESLVRLIDEEGKVISPFFFLEIAKQTKFYKQITKKVIEKSFENFKDKPYEFSINLSINDILDSEIKTFIYNMLEKYEIGQQVVFEIVESESIANFDDIHEFIQNVKDYGCKIAIDDFGTGYSNFEYLMKLNADYVKIDGSMIKNINVNKNAQLVVSTIVNFSQQLGMQTIAEYVEDNKIQTIVESLGIDYSQGYLHGKPDKQIQ